MKEKKKIRDLLHNNKVVLNRGKIVPFLEFESAKKENYVESSAKKNDNILVFKLFRIILYGFVIFWGEIEKK